MFLSEKREVTKEIDGILIKFRYPTITDEIQIEARKHTLTRGQYASMSLGILVSQGKVMDLVDAIATLNIVASFVGTDKERETYFWEGFADDDGQDFVLKVYGEFKEWRQSFRVNAKKNDGQQKSGNEKSD